MPHLFAPIAAGIGAATSAIGTGVSIARGGQHGPGSPILNAQNSPINLPPAPGVQLSPQQPIQPPNINQFLQGIQGQQGQQGGFGGGPIG